MSNETAFNLMAAKLEEAKRTHIAALEREMFSSVAISDIYYRQRTRRERLGYAWHRVVGYFSTLWMALRGVELEEPREWD